MRSLSTSASVMYACLSSLLAVSIFSGFSVSMSSIARYILPCVDWMSSTKVWNEM